MKRTAQSLPENRVRSPPSPRLPPQPPRSKGFCRVLRQVETVLWIYAYKFFTLYGAGKTFSADPNYTSKPLLRQTSAVISKQWTENSNPIPNSCIPSPVSESPVSESPVSESPVSESPVSTRKLILHDYLHKLVQKRGQQSLKRPATDYWLLTPNPTNKLFQQTLYNYF